MCESLSSAAHTPSGWNVPNCVHCDSKSGECIKTCSSALWLLGCPAQGRPFKVDSACFTLRQALPKGARLLLLNTSCLPSSPAISGANVAATFFYILANNFRVFLWNRRGLCGTGGGVSLKDTTTTEQFCRQQRAPFRKQWNNDAAAFLHSILGAGRNSWYKLPVPYVHASTVPRKNKISYGQIVQPPPPK
jgi:hypothetical protein